MQALEQTRRLLELVRLESQQKSQLIIDLNNQMRFQSWLENLSAHKEALPEGFLFLAFDNEQRGQKNYLDCGFNIMTYHILLPVLLLLI